MLDHVSLNKVVQPSPLQLLKDPTTLHPHSKAAKCSSKGKQDQRLRAAHGQVHTSKCLCTRTHTGRRGKHWQRLNVFARSRGEGKKGSRRAETNACWLLLVELWSGMEGWGNVFIPSAPLHSRPSNPPTLLSPFWKGGGWKGQPPSGSTSPSKLIPTHSDGCLIVRDTGRAFSLSNLKQIASPWGGDYWTRGMTKQGQCSPLGGGGQRG